MQFVDVCHCLETKEHIFVLSGTSLKVVVAEGVMHRKLSCPKAIISLIKPFLMIN